MTGPGTRAPAAYAFETVDVFTSERFGGNPLAVFPDARGLSDARMQALAAEFNLSETTFVLPPEDPGHTARVRIFTRTRELPFAGHPNVGTAYVLARHGRDRDGVLLFEELAGLVAVHVERDAAGEVSGAMIDAPQPLSLGASLPVEVVAACAGLDAADILATCHPPILASVGNPFLIAETTAAALARVVPDEAAFRRTLAAWPALDGQLFLYLYARDGDTSAGATVRARMFGLIGSILEDPATGSAATPLAALLLSFTSLSEARTDIIQGVEMGRPSLLRTVARRTADGIRASVGGACVPVLRGEALA
ncbi:MAG: PhzF family phenazine biosynthesis protein [Rhodospirillales bacterium]|nr:PhzF family phenazine biosynthesis protein [Rhodospirillales bacterium]